MSPFLKPFLPPPSFPLPHPISHHPFIVPALSPSLPVLMPFRLSENPFNRVRTFPSPPPGIYLMPLMDGWEMTTGSEGGRRAGRERRRRAGLGSSFVSKILWIGDRPNHITSLQKSSRHTFILHTHTDMCSIEFVFLGYETYESWFRKSRSLKW